MRKLMIAAVALTMAGCASPPSPTVDVSPVAAAIPPQPDVTAELVSAEWSPEMPDGYYGPGVALPVRQPRCIVRVTNRTNKVARLDVTVALETGVELIWSTESNASDVPAGKSALIQADGNNPVPLRMTVDDAFTCRVSNPRIGE